MSIPIEVEVEARSDKDHSQRTSALISIESRRAGKEDGGVEELNNRL